MTKNLEKSHENLMLLNQGNKYFESKCYNNAMSIYMVILRRVGLIMNNNDVNNKIRISVLDKIGRIYFNAKLYDKCIDKCNAILTILTDNNTNKIIYGKVSSLKKSALMEMKNMDNSDEKDIKSMDDDEKTVFSNNELYVKNVGFKGCGMFARRKFKKGDIIFIEESIMLYPATNDIKGQFNPNDIIKSYHEMTDDELSEFNKLYSRIDDDIYESKNSNNIIVNRCITNNMGIKINGKIYGGIFPILSRINHSCKPNCIVLWNEKGYYQMLQSTKKINKNDEITISYIDLMNRNQRRQKLLKIYGFYCECSLCNIIDPNILIKTEKNISQYIKLFDKRIQLFSDINNIDILKELLIINTKLLEMNINGYGFYHDKYILKQERLGLLQKHIQEGLYHIKDINGDIYLKGMNTENGYKLELKYPGVPELAQSICTFPE